MIEQQALIPMAAGEVLKQRRMARKLSLAAVAKAIKLDEALLRKIEQGEAGYIAPVYRNGYIQTYAGYLQVPQNKIQELIASGAAEEAALRTVFSEPPKRNAVDNWLRASSYVLASLLIGTLAWQFTHEAVRLAQSGSSLGSEQNKSPFVSPSLAQERSLSGPVNASITSFGAHHEEPASGQDMAGQAWAALSRAPLPAGEGRLQISVSADSWVEISDAGGRELEMDLLRGGSQKNYQGKAPFRILIGRASAVKLSLNGEMVDMVPFTHDDVVQMTWPQPLQAGKIQANSSASGEN